VFLLESLKMMDKTIKNLLGLKTNLDKMSKDVHEFEKAAGFDETSEKRLILALKKEIKEYEVAGSKVKKQNKLMDMVVLVMQISRRKSISLDDAWVRWWKKSAKYLGKHKTKYKKEFNAGKRH